MSRGSVALEPRQSTTPQWRRRLRPASISTAPFSASAKNAALNSSNSSRLHLTGAFSISGRNASNSPPKLARPMPNSASRIISTRPPSASMSPKPASRIVFSRNAASNQHGAIGKRNGSSPGLGEDEDPNVGDRVREGVGRKDERLGGHDGAAEVREGGQEAGGEGDQFAEMSTTCMGMVAGGSSLRSSEVTMPGPAALSRKRDVAVRGGTRERMCCGQATGHAARGLLVPSRPGVEG